MKINKVKFAVETDDEFGKPVYFSEIEDAQRYYHDLVSRYLGGQIIVKLNIVDAEWDENGKYLSGTWELLREYDCEKDIECYY